MPGQIEFAEMKKIDLPGEVQEGFDKTLGHITGAGYIPVLYVGSQVVSGVKHYIVCKENIVNQNGNERLTMVILYKTADGEWEKPEINAIL